MKNVLLTTTALVAMAGVAAADVNWAGSADIGYNDVIKGGSYYDAALGVVGSMDLGDGYAASISYGLELDMINGAATANWGMYPTIEITAPFGSLKGGDLNDKGASEYFYADRDGMQLDAENHDSAGRFDLRALVEFGDYGLAVGGVADAAGGLDGLSVGAGATFGNITLGLSYDEADINLEASATTLATTGLSIDTTFGAASIGLSYIDNTVDTSIGLEVGYDVSADLSVAAYYADNTGGANLYGVSVAYTSGALGLGAYFDSGDGATVDTMGVDVSYDVMAGLTGYVGAFDNGITTDFYAGVVYDINDNLSVTVSYADANEISGPEFMDGTSVFISASF